MERRRNVSFSIDQNRELYSRYIGIQTWGANLCNCNCFQRHRACPVLTQHLPPTATYFCKAWFCCYKMYSGRSVFLMLPMTFIQLPDIVHDRPLPQRANFSWSTLALDLLGRKSSYTPSLLAFLLFIPLAVLPIPQRPLPYLVRRITCSTRCILQFHKAIL